MKTKRLTRRQFMRGTALAGLAVLGEIPLTTRPAVAKSVTLEMWTHFAGPLFTKLTGFLKEFERDNPQIALNVTQVPLPNMLTKVKLAVAAGATPDVYTAVGGVSPELAAAGAFEPLDRFGRMPDLYPAMKAICSYKGQWLGAPVQAGLQARFHNVMLYHEAGLDPVKDTATWDTWRSSMTKLTKGGQWGTILGTKPEVQTSWTLHSLLLEAGGQLLTTDGKQAAFNDAHGEQALSFLVDLVNTQKVAPLASYSYYPDTVNQYQTGKVASLMMHSALVETIADFPFKSATTAMPSQAKRATNFAGNQMPMFAASKNKEAAWTFFEWLMRPDINATYQTVIGALPISQAGKDQAIYQQYLEKQPLAKAFADSLPFAEAVPNVLGINDIQLALGEAMEAAIYRKQTPKAALASAEEKVNGILKKG